MSQPSETTVQTIERLIARGQSDRLDTVSVVLLNDGEEPTPPLDVEGLPPPYPTIYCREGKRDGNTIPFEIVHYEGPMVKLLNPIPVVVKKSPNGGFLASTIDLLFSVDCAPSAPEAVGFLFRMLALHLKEHAVYGGFMPMDFAFGYYLKVVW